MIYRHLAKSDGLVLQWKMRLFDGLYVTFTSRRSANHPTNKETHGERAHSYAVTRQPQTPRTVDASAVPSTRLRILANAVSREVEVSSAKGENPQSSVVPSDSTGIQSAASRTRSRTCRGLSTVGFIGSITPTKTVCPGFRSSRILASTFLRSGSLASCI